MNKRGFTLIELLAVIAIMGLLTLMITPAIIKIRRDIISQTYDSRINQIERGTLDWATDNVNILKNRVNTPYTVQNTCDEDCTCIKVEDLINRGYVVGDQEEKTVLSNPKGGNFNNYFVCARYDTNDALTRKVIVYVVGE